MPEIWLLLESGSEAPAVNMAWDEALLLGVEKFGTPVLRFYGWTEPAATFGYFQRCADIESWTLLRPIIRRPTGGGFVPHDADWTYSLAFPPSHQWYGLRAEESYRRLHEWIRAAFQRLHLAVELAPRDDKQLPGRCFAGPEKSDLVWRGEKIAGAAQRRAKQGMLIQGSIQPLPTGVNRVEWQRAMTETAAELFGVRWVPFEATTVVRDTVKGLAVTKYSCDEFNRRL